MLKGFLGHGASSPRLLLARTSLEKERGRSSAACALVKLTPTLSHSMAREAAEHLCAPPLLTHIFPIWSYTLDNDRSDTGCKPCWALPSLHLPPWSLDARNEPAWFDRAFPLGAADGM